MKLSHLALGIVIIIATIVAAIITAFSLVTFSSLDKAVRNAMNSEIDYVKSSIQDILDRTVPVARSMRDVFSLNQWTYRRFPIRNQPGANNIGSVVNSLGNFTGMFEIMIANIKANRDLYAYVYLNGLSPVDNLTWSEGGINLDVTTGGVLAWIPDLGLNWTYFNISSSPYDWTVTDNFFYDSTGTGWSLTTERMQRNKDYEHGQFAPVSVFYDPVLDITGLILTYSIPLEFNSSGFALSAVNIDVNGSLVSTILQGLANKGNRMFVIDARKTVKYDGALIASSLPDLELFDKNSKVIYFPSNTKNGEVNDLMNRVFEEFDGGYDGMKISNRDVVLENYKDQVVVAAHIRAPGNFHWVVVSAVPRSYYYGSTLSAIGGTVGGGVALLILASALIVYIMLEQQKLVDGARQSVEIAQTVSRNLVLYNTDDAAIVLEKALEPTLFVVAGKTVDADGNEQDQLREEINYANKNLVLALKQINENLTVYKPHLPEYVLPQKILSEEEAEQNEQKGHKHFTKSKTSMKTMDEELMEQMGASHTSTDSHNSSERSGSEKNSGRANRTRAVIKIDAGLDDVNNPNNPYYVQASEMKENVRSKKHDDDKKEGSDTAKSNNSANKADQRSGTNISGNTHGTDGIGAVPVAKLALLRHSGDVVERVVFAHLNLSRAHEVLFPTIAFGSVPKSVTIRNVNKMIENILETASANDATVHCIVGDAIFATWNATSRVVHADVKAMRFVTTVDTLMKKELHELYVGGGGGGAASDANNAAATPDGGQSGAAAAAVSPFHDPYRTILSGGVVNGSAWCQLGGSSKRQIFSLLNFSEAASMASVVETGTKSRCVAVCRTINQNCQHEFVFRGCGLHVLPGCDTALFPNANIAQQHQSIGGDSARDQNPSLKQLSMKSGEDFVVTKEVAQKESAKAPNRPINGRSSPTQSRPIKGTLAYPIYELCSRKNLTAEDEWLYVVGGENSKGNDKKAFSGTERKANREKEMQHQQQIATMFNDLVVDAARGNGEKCRATLDRIANFDGEAIFLPAYQNLKALIRMMI